MKATKFSNEKKKEKKQKIWFFYNNLGMKTGKKRGQCFSEIGSRWWRMEPEGTGWIGVRTAVLPVAPPGERRRWRQSEKNKPFRLREKKKSEEERGKERKRGERVGKGENEAKANSLFLCGACFQLYPSLNEYPKYPWKMSLPLFRLESCSMLQLQRSGPFFFYFIIYFFIIMFFWCLIFHLNNSAQNSPSSTRLEVEINNSWVQNTCDVSFLLNLYTFSFFKKMCYNIFLVNFSVLIVKNVFFFFFNFFDEL